MLYAVKCTKTLIDGINNGRNPLGSKCQGLCRLAGLFSHTPLTKAESCRVDGYATILANSFLCLSLSLEPMFQ